MNVFSNILCVTYITDDFSSMFGSNNRDSISFKVIALSENLLNTFPVQFLKKKYTNYKMKIMMCKKLIFTGMVVENQNK